MSKDLRDAVVVITGASSGIGRATALEFAREGAKLVLGARRKALLKDLAAECEELGAEAIAVETDVSNEKSVEKIAQSAVREFGRIDVWVNDAGVATYGRFEEIPLTEHRKVIETNLLGTMYGSSAALRQFRKQHEGLLINVSSVVATQPVPYEASYVASKFAIRGLDKTLRQELHANREHDIRVCTVMPASIDTPFFHHAANHTGHPVQPIPPIYSAERVAETIVDLAHNPREEAIVGSIGKALAMQHKVAPTATDRLVARRYHSIQMEQREKAREDSGSLFKPNSRNGDISGGFKHSGEWLHRGLGTAIALAAPVAAGLLLRQRRRSMGRQPQEQAA
ncbi:MAG TPA: SDR family oxidoreductase [Terriglobales bacterium]|nr:SDR family oxidoreductase [Terriglobales bacterium]